MEPEEDDDRDDDPLDDEPGPRCSTPQEPIVQHLRPGCNWVLETKGVVEPDGEVEENEIGDTLEKVKIMIPQIFTYLATRVVFVFILNRLVEKHFNEEHMKGAVADCNDSV